MLKLYSDVSHGYCPRVPERTRECLPEGPERLKNPMNRASTGVYRRLPGASGPEEMLPVPIADVYAEHLRPLGPGASRESFFGPGCIIERQITVPVVRRA
jgi:hypothetical protein